MTLLPPSLALWRPLLPNWRRTQSRSILLLFSVKTATSCNPAHLFLLLFSWETAVLQSEGLKPDDFTWEAFQKFLDTLCLRPEIQSIFEERLSLTLLFPRPPPRISIPFSFLGE